MKYKLRAFEKRVEKYKTEKKEFDLPYLSTVIDGPIISTNNWEELQEFFSKFNAMTRDLQIGLEYIEENS